MSPRMTASSPTAPEKTSEQIVAEHISELAENVIHIHAATVKATSYVIHGSMAITIILCPFVAIAQYFISFSCFFEFFFCRLIPRIAVRMKLHGHFAV